MSIHDVYVKLAAHSLPQLPAGDESVLACMVVLHTHDFVLSNDLRLSDSPEPGGKLVAVTRRHAAEIVSEALGRAGDQGVMDYWYAKYAVETPYEAIESVPQPFIERVLACRSVMSQAPLVRAVIPSD